MFGRSKGADGVPDSARETTETACLRHSTFYSKNFAKSIKLEIIVVKTFLFKFSKKGSDFNLSEPFLKS